MVACFNFPLFFVWYLSVRGGISLSLVVVFGWVACVPTKQANQFSVILRAISCGLLSVSSAERSGLSITGLPTAFSLPLTELVTKKHFPSNLFACLAFVDCGFVFGFPSFSIVVAWWNGYHIVICMNSLYCWRLCKRALISLGLASSLLLFISSCWIHSGSFWKRKVWMYWPAFSWNACLMTTFNRFKKCKRFPAVGLLLAWSQSQRATFLRSPLSILHRISLGHRLGSSLLWWLVIDETQLFALWAVLGSTGVSLPRRIYSSLVVNGSLVGSPTHWSCASFLWTLRLVSVVISEYSCVLCLVRCPARSGTKLSPGVGIWMPWGTHSPYQPSHLH